MAGTGDSSSLILAGASGYGGSSPGARPQEKEPFYASERQKLNKINGCFPRSQDRPVLVIPPEAIMEDVDYLASHALICKFLGIRISLAALEAWIRRSWQVEGDMDIMLAGNSYFLVNFSCMSDRNRVFEGGPYFYNSVGLFVKPWHPGFNSAEDLPSRVPVWIRLPRLPLEFWREDILRQIAAVLGKPTAIAHQSLDKKVISYARICVEIDLNNPLPDSLEICLGSSSWIQQLDYESIPFRCRICHVYGHLQRQCPRASKGNGTPVGFSGPRMANDGRGNDQNVSLGKGNVQSDSAGKGKAHMNSSSQEPGPSNTSGPDKDGFIPARNRAKGRGKKRSHLDRQVDSGFNRFEVLDNMVIEEGIPTEAQCAATGSEGRSSTLSDIQDVVAQKMPEISIGPDSGALVVSPASQEKDVLLADLVKDVFASSTGKGSSLALGLMQRPFKKVSFTTPSRVGRKQDQEKIKLTGDLLVESGAVKTLDEHFPHSTQ